MEDSNADHTIITKALELTQGSDSSGDEGSNISGVPDYEEDKKSKEKGNANLFASKKREAEFHTLFRSIPEGERLIDNFSCALNREILVHGRMYLSEEHLCFNANILGWVTNVVIPIREIVSIEKRVTAFVIPNAIQISTLHNRYFFTSFMGRDEVYQKVALFWRNSLSNDPLSTVELLRRRALFVDPFLGDAKGEDIFADNTLGYDADSKQAKQEKFDYPSPKRGQVLKEVDGPNCGCSQHFSTVLTEAKVNLEFAVVQNMLFSDHSQFICGFFELIQYSNSTYEMARWSKDSEECLSRQYVVNVPLPRLLLGDSQAKATFQDKILLFDETRFIVQCQVCFEGVPGGRCEIHWRCCMNASPSQGQAKCTEIMVTGDAYPPKNSWFKESIKQALLTHARNYWSTLLSQCELKASNVSLRKTKQFIKWHNYDEVHFDLGAFFRSFKVILPILIVFMAIYVYNTRIFSDRRQYGDVLKVDKTEIHERVARSNRLREEVELMIKSKGLCKEKVVPNSEKLSDPIDRLMQRLSRLESLAYPKTIFLPNNESEDVGRKK